MMPYLMRGKNEAAVYFEQTLDVTRTLAWLDAVNRGGAARATIFHVVLRALADVLHERPRLNRFAVGRKIYDRDGVHISFAAKKKMSDDAPLATVKREFPAGESFAAMMEGLSGAVGEARSDRKSAVDKELALFLRLPGPVLDAAVGLLRRLDAWGLAPKALLDPDPMYASAFVANLGSIKIDAAYHHLYEHGNCPLFVTVGQIQPRPLVDAGGAIAVRPTVMLRYTYDERIEDGLYAATALDLLRRRVEDPASVYGQAAPAVSLSTSA
jgi:pyruvate/2-oxoglutarate dehydrogenase complex dihydrolipoamide acyltransferase (E2) component